MDVVTDSAAWKQSSFPVKKEISYSINGRIQRGTSFSKANGSVLPMVQQAIN
jgi:hypothetical protein